MEVALTFDDVCLVPRFNNVESREDPSLMTWFSKKHKVASPLIPANMDTVISPELAHAVHDRGGMWIMHRFFRGGWFQTMKDYPKPYGISVGVHADIDERRFIEQRLPDIRVICVDVAHAHGRAACEQVATIKGMVGDKIDVVAGNVCTPRGYIDLVNAGADVVKVGVGCGAACTTRLVTGFGVPQFSAIREVAAVADEYRVPIVADGGIRTSRDVVLALAAGASTVMMGKLFAGVDISAAKKEMRLTERWNGDGIPNEALMARYRGQASFDFQAEFYGEVRHAPEGEAFWIPVTGTYEETVEPLHKAIKAGMTYAGAKDIQELQRKARFRRVTHTYQAESGIRP